MPSHKRNCKVQVTLDIGNSRIKFAIWERGRLVQHGIIPEFNLTLIPKSHLIDSAAVCNTSGIEFPELKSVKFSVLQLSYRNKLPFESKYKTPETLGADRIAAIAGVCKLYPNENVLIIDAGTCITTDFIDDKSVYRGGAISPGMEMRYKALHNYTGKLPLVKHKTSPGMLGNSTEESIISGVWEGILGELNYRIHQLLKKYPEIKVVITGGDSEILANNLKYRIFAEPLLIHHGLLHCLKLNEL